MRTTTVLSLGAIIATSLLTSTAARAQETGFAVNRFEPSERGSTWFATESLDFRGGARPALGVVGDYQHLPLAIYDTNGNVRSAVVEHMMTAHVGASFVLAERLRLSASLPVHLYNDGERGRLAGRTYDAPRDAQGVGDLRFGVDARLFGKWDGPATSAIGAQLWAPTGDTQSYTSDGRVRVAPRVLFAGQAGWLAYSARVGLMIRDPEAASFANSPVGHEFTYGAAAGIRVADNRWTVGPEAFGSTGLEDAFKTRSTPFEVLLGTHYSFESGLRLGAGVGPGLTRGYGSPAVRALLSLEWSPDVIDDRDGDGVKDSEDACPDTPGARSADPAQNGCPPPPPPPADRDHDGILDKDDACPDTPGTRTADPKTNGCADRDARHVDAGVDVPGVASSDPKQHGCPELDTDGDGVLDKDDACPTEPGLRTEDPKTNGCPDPDRDKDGVLNDVDACPDEPGKADPDPKKNGCPKAFVAQGQIKILDQVKFKVGSAQILPGKDSEEVLDAVLKVLTTHPEITKMRIEGHTDNTGSAALNRKLSKARAASVAAWLVKKGIEKDRLTSDGFGPDKPLDVNTTEDGRRNNRRVEFHIVEQTPASKPQ